MKLNKDNCRVYNKYDDGTIWIETKLIEYDYDFTKVKVIEIPKVWREYGKQYKVTHVSFDTVGADLYGIKGVIVKAPRGCQYYGPWSNNIEYYD